MGYNTNSVMMPEEKEEIKKAVTDAISADMSTDIAQIIAAANHINELDNNVNENSAAIKALLADKKQYGGNWEWAEVVEVVDSGNAPVVFPLGTQFTIDTPTVSKQVWDVVSHDDVIDQYGNKVHGMQLQQHYTSDDAVPFSAATALYVAPDGLAAGIYYFTIPASYDVNYNDLKTDEDTETVPIQFTTTKDLPPGGQLRLNWGNSTNLSQGAVYTYANQRVQYTTVEPLTEKCSISRGTGGTLLGHASANTYTGNFAPISRNRYGSNNYKESFVRQRLRSADAANTYWQPQTPFDRMPSQAITQHGFLYDLPEDFINAICPIQVRTCTNDYDEYDPNDAPKSSYLTTEKIYLPSFTEVCGSKINNIAEGKRFDITIGYVQADWIKRTKSGAAQLWWYRSPVEWSTHYARGCSNTGITEKNYIASSAYRLAPACTIAKSTTAPAANDSAAVEA